MKFTNRAEAERAKSDAIAAARGIAAKANDGGRNLTPDERGDIERLVATAKSAQDAIAGFNGDRAMLDDLSSLFSGPGGGGRKATPRGDGTWAKAMGAFLGRVGMKSLVPSGTITVPRLSSGITASQDRPRSVLNLIPFIGLEGTDSFAFLRETVRTHAASTVAAGKVKPTSTYSVEKVEDRVRTIAHLSEPINRATIADVELLSAYLEGALRDGVMLELEDQVLNGDGATTGVLDDLVGILNTEGIQAQPFVTDRLVTARKAVTVLEDENLDPAGFAWAMSPSEWEAFELLTSESHFLLSDPGTAGSSLPIDRARRMLWGYKVVTSGAMGAGEALLGDFAGSVAIREREDVRIDWSEAVTIDGATAFERNQVVFRAEGRWGLAVMRPSAFVEVDLDPSGS